MNTKLLQILGEHITDAYANDKVKSVWTPFELAEQMLSVIEVKGSILVLSDLGFIPVLKQRGADLRTVKFAAHTQEQATLATLMGVGEVFLIGYNDPIKELKQKLMGMKFDIVVGNPPYQGKTPGQKLWISFLRLVAELKPKETLLVTPSMWINRDLPQAQKVRDLIAEMGLKSAWRCDVASDGRPYFNIGESVCWYHLGNSETHSVDGAVFYTPYRGEIISTNPEEKLVHDIIAKVRAMKVSAEKTGVRWTLANPAEMGEKYSKVKTTLHSNPVMHTASQWYFTSEDTSAFKGPKLLINISGHYKNSEKYILVHEEAVAGNGARQIAFNSIREAEIARSLFISSLYIFSVNAKKSGGFNDVGFLPVLESDVPWTEEMVWRKFNITAEEQQFIKAWLIQHKLV